MIKKFKGRRKWCRNHCEINLARRFQLSRSWHRALGLSRVPSTRVTIPRVTGTFGLTREIGWQSWGRFLLVAIRRCGRPLRLDQDGRRTHDRIDECESSLEASKNDWERQRPESICRSRLECGCRTIWETPSDWQRRAFSLG